MSSVALGPGLAPDVIPPELEEDDPIADEIAAFEDDPYGLDAPDEHGLGNSWDWGGEA